MAPSRGNRCSSVSASPSIVPEVKIMTSDPQRGKLMLMAAKILAFNAV